MERNKQRVVIMGGTSGVGLATAKVLAEANYDVVITGRQEAKLAQALKELDYKATGEVVDSTSAPQLEAFFQKIDSFDHLVLSLSGGEGAGEFRTLDLASLRHGFEAKFWPQLQSTQIAIPKLRSGGSITFVTAISARFANPGTAGLAAINGALEVMIPILALELKPTRINAVSPGAIDTPWWDRFPTEQRKAYFKQVAEENPVGRAGQATDIAQSIIYLINNGFTTGTILECDGGMKLK